MKKYIDSAIIIALASAIFYMVGISNYSGFVFGAGLEWSVMDIGFHRAVYIGFTLLHRYILLLFLLALIVFIAFRLHRSLISLKTKRKLLLKIFHYKRLKGFDRFVFYHVVFVCILLTAYQSLQFFRYLGEDYANHIIAQHKGTEETKNKKPVKIKYKSKSGSLLTCGSIMCAVIEDKTNRVFYFEYKNGFEIIENDKSI